MFERYNYKAKIIDVYDGDTITAVVDFGCTITQTMKLRLARIDAPELRTGDKRLEGMAARDFVRDRILGKDVFIKTIKDKQEKFGRYLAEVYYWVESLHPVSDGITSGVYVCLNDELVREEMAVYRDY